MGIVSAKVFAGLVAGSIAVSGVAYTGATHMDNIKSQIVSLQDKAELFHDQAYKLGQTANSIISNKNGEISRLEGEVTRLETELTTSNGNIDSLEASLEDANANINQANADVKDVSDTLDQAVTEVEALPEIAPLVDEKAKVNGMELGISVIQSQSERTIRFNNPNTVDVTVYFNGTSQTIKGGDVVYKKFPNTTVFSYTVPTNDGTGKAVTVTK
ncbi:hypothetical protein [Rossellomorea sp. NRS-1567]|uniref:hypothetical protein n=1 Tax=Rossellomorea sp. NRS-1567 TaxID=3233901 RepID=UPI003D2D8292